MHAAVFFFRLDGNFHVRKVNHKVILQQDVQILSIASGLLDLGLVQARMDFVFFGQVSVMPHDLIRGHYLLGVWLAIKGDNSASRGGSLLDLTDLRFVKVPSRANLVGDGGTATEKKAGKKDRAIYDFHGFPDYPGKSASRLLWAWKNYPAMSERCWPSVEPASALRRAV